MHELELPALHLINYSDPVSGGSDSSPPVRLTECLPLISSCFSLSNPSAHLLWSCMTLFWVYVPNKKVSTVCATNPQNFVDFWIKWKKQRAAKAAQTVYCCSSLLLCDQPCQKNGFKRLQFHWECVWGELCSGKPASSCSSITPSPDYLLTQRAKAAL